MSPRAWVVRCALAIALALCVGTPAHAEKPAPSEVLDLNAAPLEELARLPGIGPVRAERIVERRQRRPFRAIAELRSIRGIGPKIFSRVSRFLRVGAPAGPPKPAPAGSG